MPEVLYAASPLLFGAPAERLFAQLGFDSLVELGAAYPGSPTAATLLHSGRV